jgi:hypothetical protein
VRSIIARWISTAQRTASTTLENSTSMPPPGLEDAAVMLPDLRVDKLAAMRLQAIEGALLVPPISRE